MTLRSPRLQAELGPNELRDYLAGKKETGREAEPKTFHLYRNHPRMEWLPRTLLISPPLTIPRDVQRRCIPPLGLCYIAAALEEAGYPVELLDCAVEDYGNEAYSGDTVTYGLSIADTCARAKKAEADVIGLSVLFSTELPLVLELATALKEAIPGVLILVGGLHPTIYPKDALGGHPGAVDWILRGEGEHRFTAFLDWWREGYIDLGADGLAGWIDGRLVINPQVETISDLDSLPFPAYHLLPMERYFEINVPFSPVPQGDRVMQILTSRGCPIGCTFCASTNLYKAYRPRSVKNVVEEIELWKELYQVDELQFADDNLTLAPARTEQLMTALEGVGLRWCTPNGTMVNTLSPELLTRMKKAGIYQITLSLDSACVRTLKELHHKPVDLDRIPELVRVCKKLGIWTHGTLVIGMPGETLEELSESLERVLEDFEFVSIATFIAQPIPGSELYHIALDRTLMEKPGRALNIDTSKAPMRLSDIDQTVLENLAADFQKRFAERARQRDPETWQKKYGKQIERGLLDTGQGKLGYRNNSSGEHRA